MHACLYALAKENSATTVCCATHYNEPLLKAGKYLVANALTKVI